jgi:hypothetical protein
MVQSLLGIGRPLYTHDTAAGVWRQSSTAEFPAVTDDPAEVLDPTFYTSAPPTSVQINTIVAGSGGGGVVVSKRECLAHFDAVRALTARAGIVVDPDPAAIREWSLVKALTGVLIARERGLIAPGTDVVVHASGYYTDALIAPLPADHTHSVSTPDDLAQLITAAAAA